MIGFRFIIVLLCAAVLFAACNQPCDQTADRERLDEAINAFYDNIERGDKEAHAAVFTDEAIMMPDGYDYVQGKEAVTAMVTGGEGWVFRIRDRKVVDTRLSGDIAYTVNDYYYTWHAEGSEPEWHATKNVHIWHRQPDGSWKLHIDIWNSSGDTGD